jgi:hypothetical protein
MSLAIALVSDTGDAREMAASAPCRRWAIAFPFVLSAASWAACDEDRTAFQKSLHQLRDDVLAITALPHYAQTRVCFRRWR